MTNNIAYKVWEGDKYVPYSNKHFEKFGVNRSKLHCEHGPAIVWSDGMLEYFQNGRLHRVDGPAIELPNGVGNWFLNGKYISNDDVEEWLFENDIDLKTIEGQITFKMYWG